MSNATASLPAVLRVDDDLEAIQADVGGDPAVAIEQAREDLARFEVREAATQASLLDDVESLLLRAQEQVEGDHARRLEAIRNRIRIYREAVSDTDEDLAVIDATVRTETEDESAIRAVRGEPVELVATVVNGGRARRVVVVAAFYDESGAELEQIATDELGFDADEQAAVELGVVVPGETAYYTATALDAETQTVG
ncbi:hypothetical protein [Natrononativus amylolyticus]|uniref:hypothetical protein n=1 Tax=Natrononativus amylolyticus TaxID=2963434 RepID=UPI0020CBDA0F|nr:hypothetical protein [Natrononativus amylolyticus]